MDPFSSRGYLGWREEAIAFGMYSGSQKLDRGLSSEQVKEQFMKNE